MGKLLLAVAMLVGFAGPAVASHESMAPMIEGTRTPSQTPFCRAVEDARLIGEEFAAGGADAAKLLLGTFGGPGLSRCGSGGGMVVPLELMDTFTAPTGAVMFIIRVRPGNLNFELFLMTLRPWIMAGKPA